MELDDYIRPAVCELAGEIILSDPDDVTKVNAERFESVFEKVGLNEESFLKVIELIS